MRVTVITPPAAIVTAADAKVWAPVLAGDPDARITALLAAAQAAIEPPNGWVGRAFGVQTLDAYFDGFCPNGLCLPCPPLREVVEIAYRERDGDEVTLDPATYRAIGIGSSSGLVVTAGSSAWPAHACGPQSVRVRFKAGYAVDDLQLSMAKHAVVLAATHLRSLGTQDLALRSEEVEGVGTTTWTVSEAAQKLVGSTVDRLLAPYKVWTL